MSRELANNLREIEIGEEKLVAIGNWYFLNVKRSKENRFKVKFEENCYTFLAPILIVFLDKQKIKYYPSFNFKTIVNWGLIPVLPIYLVCYFIDNIEPLIVSFLPVLLILEIQLVAMPILFFVLKRRLRKNME